MTTHSDKTTPDPGLGARLRDLFTRAEAERREIEQRWLADLRQYRGQYDPAVLSRLHAKRSKAFVRLTRAKVRAVDARLMDLLFPGSGQFNWDISPTPVPELPREIVQELADDFAAREGRTPDAAETAALVRREAARAASAMAAVMRDQLAETRYREIVRDVVHSGNLYGTGILKGPLVERRPETAWRRRGESWVSAERLNLSPFIEFVPLWDFYPDMRASRISDAAYVFQRHVMTRAELEALGERPDFDQSAIRAHLAANPEGDVDVKGFESELSTMNPDNAATAPRGDRFEVLEFWGKVRSSEIGCEDGDGVSLPATVWLLGRRLIKSAPSPLAGASAPYFLYHFDKDETCLFGEGLASIMRDPQQLFNASVREGLRGEAGERFATLSELADWGVVPAETA